MSRQVLNSVHCPVKRVGLGEFRVSLQGVLMKKTAFWDMTRFGPVDSSLCFDESSVLKIEVAGSTETSVLLSDKV